MADFLPPEILRFLLIRPFPRQPVNFEPGEVYIIKLFNDFDRYHQKYHHDPDAPAGDRRIYELSEVDPEPDHWLADFQLVAALTQMPHLDLVKELEKRKKAPFTDLERRHLELRIRAARYWVEHHATEDELTRLQEALPARASELSEVQRAFLRILAGMLASSSVVWEGEALQVAVFDAARLTPIDQPSAFKAIYRVLLDRENGPKAGNFLSFLDRGFVVRRFEELPGNRVGFWVESASTPGAFREWAAREKTGFRSGASTLESVAATDRPGCMIGVLELRITAGDGKVHLRRVRLDGQAGPAPLAAVPAGELQATAGRLIDEAAGALQIRIAPATAAGIPHEGSATT